VSRRSNRLTSLDSEPRLLKTTANYAKVTYNLILFVALQHGIGNTDHCE